MIEVLDLFSGIGGFSLGLESTGGFRTIGFCEIEPFPREVLRKHWPGVPIWEDIRELTAESLGGLQPDAIVGGFPCQDISVAGKGAGLDGARSGLWSEFARLVVELRPRWVIVENVGALRTRGVDRVCSDLEAQGYSVWPLLVGAWAVGAPHKRDRVWIVAHRDGEGRSEQRSGSLLDGERAASGHDPDRRGERPVGDGQRNGLQGQRSGRDVGGSSRNGSGSKAPRADRQVWPARPGEAQYEWEEPRLAYAGRGSGDGRQISAGPEQAGASVNARGNGAEGDAQLPVGGAAHGLPERLARRWNREALKALGNSVVPQVVATIGRAILSVENCVEAGSAGPLSEARSELESGPRSRRRGGKP